MGVRSSFESKKGPYTTISQRPVPQPQADFLFKLLLIGDESIGKTSMMQRYADEMFSGCYIRTRGVDWRILTLCWNIKGREIKIKIQIWDMESTTTVYRGAHGVVFCFDLTDRETWENTPKWMTQVQRHCGEYTKLIWVGTKLDLTSERVVSRKEVEEFLKQKSAEGWRSGCEFNYVEISSKNDVGVQTAVGKLILEILKDSAADIDWSGFTPPTTKMSRALAELWPRISVLMLLELMYCERDRRE